MPAKKPPQPSDRVRDWISTAHRWLWRREVAALLVMTIGLLASLFLFAGSRGSLTAPVALALRQALGIGAYPLALTLLGGGLYVYVRFALGQDLHPPWKRIIGIEIALVALLGFVHLCSAQDALFLARQGRGGGYLGFALSLLLAPYLGRLVGGFLLLIILLLGLYLAVGIPAYLLWYHVQHGWAMVGTAIRSRITRRRYYVEAREQEASAQAAAEAEARAAAIARAAIVNTTGKQLQEQPTPAKSAPATPAPQPQAPVAPPKRRRRRKRNLPSLDLLLADQVADEGDTDARHQAETIENTLAAFGVPAEVVEWNRGPVVTQFGIEPGYVERTSRDGVVQRHKVRVSKILGLQNDLALALAAAPIRIEAPIPGRSVVGVEVPNRAKSMVGLRSVLESKTYRGMRTNLRVALGRSVSGDPVIADLARMPHLLIAGATGSGKSACLNAIVVSLLYQNTPDDLRLILVDPKRVELTRFNGIPHLLSPALTDVTRVIVSLRWLLKEMESRYKAFADASVRDLRGYNRKAQEEGWDTKPHIVVAIDELADLMLAAPDEVERTICRLAQMSRATGIHLVIATQRPSVDVVTGLIKANFPARISFAVTSQVDSRVVLDTPGAEKLLGQGDMLFMPPDTAKLMRVQGCWVSDQELRKVVHHWLVANPEAAAHEEESVPWDEPEMAAQVISESPEDALIRRAIQVVQKRTSASSSFLQRHLKIGYPRAAALMDELEARGIVGPAASGGRARMVLRQDGDATPLS